MDAANGTPAGGLIVEPTDAEAARQLFTALRTFITLGGDQVGATVRDEDYNGTTITIVEPRPRCKLSGMAGGSAGALPLPVDKVEIAYAVTDDIVVIGSGPAFVKSVLDTRRRPRLHRTRPTRSWPIRPARGPAGRTSTSRPSAG